MARSFLVHPTDLLATSEGAFYHALKLGLAGRCELGLVHVHTYETEEIPDIDSFPQVRETLARWGLLPEGAPQSDVSEKLGLHVSKAEVLAVNAERGLAKLLRNRNAQMIVLGTRGLTGLQRLFERSFSEQLARDTRLPALFVPSGCDGFVSGEDGSVRLKNVLLPVAEQPDAGEAVRAAQLLADMLGQAPQFHVLHVGHGGDLPAVRLDPARVRHDMLRQGPVEETIVRVADEIDADLIVMATAGHKGFLDALRGSSTEEVLRKARRPLLAVPSE